MARGGRLARLPTLPPQIAALEGLGRRCLGPRLGHLARQLAAQHVGAQQAAAKRRVFRNAIRIMPRLIDRAPDAPRDLLPRVAQRPQFADVANLGVGE